MMFKDVGFIKTISCKGQLVSLDGNMYKNEVLVGNLKIHLPQQTVELRDVSIMALEVISQEIAEILNYAKKADVYKENKL